MSRVVCFLLLFTLVTMASASDNNAKRHYDIVDARNLFEQFKNDFERNYADKAEEEMRFGIFVESLKKINEMNEASPSATFGINKFADYTKEELGMMRGLKSK